MDSTTFAAIMASPESVDTYVDQYGGIVLAYNDAGVYLKVGGIVCEVPDNGVFLADVRLLGIDWLFGDHLSHLYRWNEETMTEVLLYERNSDRIAVLRDDCGRNALRYLGLEDRGEWLSALGSSLLFDADQLSDLARATFAVRYRGRWVFLETHADLLDYLEAHADLPALSDAAFENTEEGLDLLRDAATDYLIQRI